MRVGTARVDITPTEPIRLCGYAARHDLSEGVEQPISAKALAIRAGKQPPAVLLSVELTAIPAVLTEHVARQLYAKANVPRERFVICCTHTHTAPCVDGALPNMFGHALPANQRAAIRRYTERLLTDLESVALSALECMQPAGLSYCEGKVAFGANRRTQNGPVDDALPVLVARNLEGKVLAVVVNCACHCTTLGTFNRVCGDWAGYAQQAIEADHPGSTALVTIGCGADVNPSPRGRLEQAKKYGRQVAEELRHLLSKNLVDLHPAPLCLMTRTKLTLDQLPNREQWRRRAARSDAMGYHARQYLNRLDQGRMPPSELSYPVQVWSFGDGCLMVFLAGEVVADYALRLRAAYAGRPLWITAYANDVPCYIPSRRVLQEGGYEPDESILYYDQPARLADSVEETIICTVRSLIEQADARASHRGGAAHE